MTMREVTIRWASRAHEAEISSPIRSQLCLGCSSAANQRVTAIRLLNTGLSHRLITVERHSEVWGRVRAEHAVSLHRDTE